MKRVKRRWELEQQNFILRRRVNALRAQLTLARLERDAARTALANFNHLEAAKEIERKYGIDLGLGRGA